MELPRILSPLPGSSRSGATVPPRGASGSGHQRPSDVPLSLNRTKCWRRVDDPPCDDTCQRSAAGRSLWIAPVYAANPKVAAVILAGSTARGDADRFSDIELGVFWHEPPTEDERLAAVEQAGGELETVYLLEDDAWYDDWKLGRHGGVPKSGVSIDMPHQTVATVDATLAAVLVRHDPHPLKQNTISAILDGIPFHGHELLEEWRERAEPYPDELATSVVRMHGQISHFWRFRMLAVRRNPLHAYMSIVSTHETVLHLLLAINRVYYFGFKSLDAVMARLPIAPPGSRPATAASVRERRRRRCRAAVTRRGDLRPRRAKRAERRRRPPPPDLSLPAPALERRADPTVISHGRPPSRS